jgi:DNA-binding transcriptional LysR family regulator
MHGKLLFCVDSLLDLCMDRQKSSFDWNQARAFWATAETGSLSAAARALGLTQPTIGRQVSALEDALQVALFERAGHNLMLTPIGTDLLGHVRKMGLAADQIALVASGHSQAIEGPISITASEFYSITVLPPIIAKLRIAYPGIDVRVVATNAQTDLLRREADIAIRNFNSLDDDLIVTRLRDDAANLYATPAYLERIGNPQTAAEFAHADFIGFVTSSGLVDNLRDLGFPITSDNFKASSDSMIVQWELVKLGVGIGIGRKLLGESEPSVVRALPSLKSIEFPVWLVTHRELHTSKRVRVVFDFLKCHLR